MIRLLKPLFVLVLILFTPQIIFAQDAEKTVEIVVSGSAKTQDEAKQLALRSAIEQAFGVFISSKTEILNDNLVSDQITSIASGNIKSYQVLNESQLPDGSWGVTLKSIVSIDKLTSFVQAKGVEVEVKGSLFALNIKQQILNEQAEIKAINDLVGLLHEQMQISFDYKIKSGEPKSIDSENKNWEIPLEVSIITNKNIDFCLNYCLKTLAALSLSTEEVTSYQSLDKNVFDVILNYKGTEYTFNLRKESSLKAFNSLIEMWDFYISSFLVTSGLDEIKFIRENLYRKHFLYHYNTSGYRKIYFPTSDIEVGYYSFKYKRTLSEIEKITEFKVKPRGIVSIYRHGGFVINEENGHGLVLSISDLGDLNNNSGRMNWNSANLICNELLLNGYNDWYLPTIEELNNIYLKFGRNFLDNGNNKFYWSSSFKENYGFCYSFSFDDKGTVMDYNPSNAWVRAVRKF